MKADLTICLPYYENPSMLSHQLTAFASMGKTVRNHMRLIVVDDGSPNFPAADVVRRQWFIPFDFSLYRMGVDVPWNQDACRNLAMSQCQTEWALLTDMDHHVPEETIARVISKPLDPSVVYTFSRVTAPTMEPYKPHPNSWLLTREMYDQIGGYDERYAGIYGTDGIFAARVEATCRKVVARKEVLVRVPREVVPDASTTSLERKSDANTERRMAKRAEIEREVEAAARPVRGRFPWERIL